MNRSKWMRVVASAVLVTAAAEAPPAQLATARETAKQVMVGTKALLETEIKDKGAAGALGACSRVALDMARAHEREGWRVRRVSDRLRNPADAPDAWEKRALARFAVEHRAKPLAPETETWEVVRERGARVLRYAKPVVIPGDVCLRCHGERAAIEPAVRDSIARLYPRDRALGYRVGDLRGAISVRIPL